MLARVARSANMAVSGRARRRRRWRINIRKRCPSAEGGRERRGGGEGEEGDEGGFL